MVRSVGWGRVTVVSHQDFTPPLNTVVVAATPNCAVLQLVVPVRLSLVVRCNFHLQRLAVLRGVIYAGSSLITYLPIDTTLRKEPVLPEGRPCVGYRHAVSLRPR